MRRDNRGLTLVELLVAMTILAIVLVPLLHAFTTAARVNAKAKNNFRATTVAQTLMEQMSAYTMEENVLHFYEKPTEFQIYPSSNAYYTDANYAAQYGEILAQDANGVTKETASVKDTNGDGTKEFADRSASSFSDTADADLYANRYAFFLKGVKTDDGKGVYDIRVSYDASGYREATATNGLTDQQLYNNNLQASVTNYDPQRDVLVVQSADDDQTMAQKFLAAYPDKTRPLSFFLSNMHRVFTIAVSDGGNDTTQVDVNGFFSFYDPYSHDRDQQYQISYGSYTFTKDLPLQNIFFCYQPNYASRADENGYPDQINLYNYIDSASYPSILDQVGLSLIKQVPVSTDETILDAVKTSETNYQVKVVVWEQRDTTPQEGYVSRFSLRTNYTTNIGYQLTATSTQAEQAAAQLPSQATYQYYYFHNVMMQQVSDPEKVQQYLSMQPLQGLQQEQNRLYTTTIEVYASGAADAGFPEEKRLAVLSNQGK